jgi:hypothetical protein
MNESKTSVIVELYWDVYNTACFERQRRPHCNRLKQKQRLLAHVIEKFRGGWQSGSSGRASA